MPEIAERQALEGRAGDAALPFVLDGGSFRDPRGTVVHAGGRVLRLVDATACRELRAAASEGILDDLIRDGLLVESRLLGDDDEAGRALRDRFPWAEAVYEHRRIALPTYPSEWTFAMIADAGILTLDAQLRLVRRGWTLQDASAYNVLFDGVRPVFIDLTSIQPAPRRDIWYALGQFQRMFLYPLLLHRHCGIESKGYYLAHLDGLDARSMARILGPSRLFRPRFLLDVTLPAWLGGAGSRRGGSASGPRRAAGSPEVQRFLLRRLRRKLERLRSERRPRSRWSAYEERNSYTEESRRMKSQHVEDFLRSRLPRTVADVGCNTGCSSRMAARLGAKVIAIDSDHDCVDALYRSLAAEGASAPDIQPVWMGLENPTPAIGLSNAERPSFLARCRADAVLALALSHHLLVSCRIPFELQAKQFSEIAGEWLLVEYVDPRDEMFRVLAAYREDLYRGVTEEGFLRAFEERFRLVEALRLPGGTRTIFTLRKR